MPTPRLQPGHERWPDVERAVELYEQLGSYREVGNILGEASDKIANWIERYKLIQSQDPAIQQAKAAVNTNLEPVLAWAKTKSEDGTSYSVLLKPPKVADGLVDAIKSAFEGLSAFPATPPPVHSNDDLLTIYPIADAHVGMMAWGKETGEDYDTRKACDRLRSWVGQCLQSSPQSREAFIVDVGDLLHADDQNNATPRSKHVLDVDTRFFRTVEMVIAALATAVETALERHQYVTVVILPGNHDPHAYLAVLFALAERYRDEPRITVVKEPGEFFAHRFGRNMIAFHHGDKAKAERLVLSMADEYPEMWGGTKYRYLFTGHLHHHKSADIGGVHWEQLRAMTARDAYARSHAYSARAQLQGITLHKERGEVSRVKVSE